MPRKLSRLERMIIALERKGGKRLPDLTHLVVMSDPDAGVLAHIPEGTRYFIGKKGALSRGTSRATAFTLHENYRQKLLIGVPLFTIAKRPITGK